MRARPRSISGVMVMNPSCRPIPPRNVNLSTATAKFENWTLFEKYVMGRFLLQKETDCFFFVLPHPKRGEQSVGRDHIGATLGFSDTRIRTNDQWFDWRAERS